MLNDNFNKNWLALKDIDSILVQVKQQIQSNNHSLKKILEYKTIERTLNDLKQHATVNLFAIMIDIEKIIQRLEKEKESAFNAHQKSRSIALGHGRIFAEYSRHHQHHIKVSFAYNSSSMELYVKKTNDLTQTQQHYRERKQLLQQHHLWRQYLSSRSRCLPFTSLTH